MGLQCLSSECSVYKNAKGKPVLHLKLKNNTWQYLDISYGWENDLLIMRKGVYN
jgi:hypothetical protein